MRRVQAAIFVAVALLGLVSAVRPATAVGIGVGGISGGVTVYPDLASCATVTFSSPTTFAGEFTASGVLYGPGTIVMPVAGAKPIIGVNTTTWSGCIPGGYSGATSGYVVFTLTVTSPARGEYVEVKQCAVTFGSVFCV